MVKRSVLILLLPLLVFAGYLLSDEAPGFIDSAYEDFGGPFLITYWIGLGFANAWDQLRQSMLADRFSPGMMAATGIVCALIFLSMLGGVSTLWHDPWLFGVAVAPGFELARPFFERWPRSRRPEPLDPGDGSAAGDVTAS